MNAHDENRTSQLLRQAVPPVDPGAEPARDLWPAVLRRLDAENAGAGVQPASLLARQNWFDWALVAGLAIFACAFPAAIPVFLYYL